MIKVAKQTMNAAAPAAPAPIAAVVVVLEAEVEAMLSCVVVKVVDVAAVVALGVNVAGHV